MVYCDNATTTTTSRGPSPEMEQFLTSLAVKQHVAASTQNQALAALLFLYKDVLELDPGWLDDVVRAKRPQRLPTVLTRKETEAVLGALGTGKQ
jgi:site-specific recombinase XerD